MYPVAEDTSVCSLHIHRNFKNITKSVHFVQANLRKDWSGFRVGWIFRPGPTPLLGLGSLTCQIWAPAVASMQHGHEYSTRTFSVGGCRNLCLPSDKNSLAWFLASLLPYTHWHQVSVLPRCGWKKGLRGLNFHSDTLICALPLYSAHNLMEGYYAPWKR